MELKTVTMDQLANIQGKHALIIVSDGKARLVDLPAYGKIEISCHENKVKVINQKLSAQF